LKRSSIAHLAIFLIIGLLVFDLLTARLNPYVAPPIIALGSGQATSGGFCGALPK